MKKEVAAWLALMLITVVAAACLALTNEKTRDIIAAQEEQNAETARKTLISSADAFEPVDLSEDSGLTTLYAGKENGETVGYVAMVTATGFGGPVEVTVGMDMDGRVIGISVGGSQFSETAGLGAKAKEETFTAQFDGREIPLRVVKSAADRADDTIDAITSATITSTAVTNAVNTAGEYVKTLLTQDAAD